MQFLSRKAEAKVGCLAKRRKQVRVGGLVLDKLENLIVIPWKRRDPSKEWSKAAKAMQSPVCCDNVWRGMG